MSGSNVTRQPRQLRDRNGGKIPKSSREMDDIREGGVQGKNNEQRTNLEDLKVHVAAPRACKKGTTLRDHAAD